MANQGVSNERKKELEQMDPFQESLVKGFAYVKAHKKQIYIAVGAVVVVCVIFSSIMYSFKRSEAQASQLASQAAAQYDRIYSADQDALNAYESVKEMYQKVLDEYANTSAGRMAMVRFAKICFDAKVYDKSFDLYSKALSSLGNDAGMENFLLSALGNLALMKKDMHQAKSFFLRIEQGASDLLKDEARFSLALIYEGENNHADSLKMYEKIVNDPSNSMYEALARAHVDQAKG